MEILTKPDRPVLSNQLKKLLFDWQNVRSEIGDTLNGNIVLNRIRNLRRIVKPGEDMWH